MRKYEKCVIFNLFDLASVCKRSMFKKWWIFNIKEKKKLICMDVIKLKEVRVYGRN